MFSLDKEHMKHNQKWEIEAPDNVERYKTRTQIDMVTQNEETNNKFAEAETGNDKPKKT